MRDWKAHTGLGTWTPRLQTRCSTRGNAHVSSKFRCANKSMAQWPLLGLLRLQRPMEDEKTWKKRTKRFDGWQSKQSLRVEIKPLAALQHATKNNIKHDYSVCSQVLEFHKIHSSSWRIRFFSFHHCSILFSSLFLITLLVLLRFSSLLSRPQGKPSPATQEKGLLRLLAKAPGWQTMNPSNTIQKCHETKDMTSRRAMEWTRVVGNRVTKL